MEALLQGIVANQKTPSLSKPEEKKIRHALDQLAEALRSAAPILSPTTTAPPTTLSSTKVTAEWLLSVCQQADSVLGAELLAQSIYQVAEGQLDENQQQAALFELLGASESAMAVLMEVTPHLAEIRRLRPENLAFSSTANVDGDVFVDLEEERRQLLLQEAMDTAQVAAVAKAEVEALEEAMGGATHTIQRSSHQEAQKRAQKAAERAAKALKRAKDAGAIVDESDLLSVDRTSLGAGGLMNRTHEELVAVQQALLPEGSRMHYDNRGLPNGTIRETDADGTQRAIIPAARRDESNLHPRLLISDVLDVDSAKAFAGTSSLNHMQSKVFEVAFHKRDNMLVCAPTGAGKTNVAMLAVTSHFQDVGLIGGSSDNLVDTAKKVVYIAPMKALAQEVVEKFSSKLKPLGLIVRELTGDMQLTRAEADAAHVLVTTPEKWDVVTRKSGTEETSLGAQCGLLIIDEVHLLADERGAVIESIVARLHRFVEARQRQVRIVALSATLPNYDDVAEFLQVPERGLFFFGPEYRPVPLQQQFIGVNVKSRNNRAEKDEKMNAACYEIVLDSLRRGYQVMVFVHSRKGTGDAARSLAETAAKEDLLGRYFLAEGKEGPVGDAHKRYVSKVKKSRNREVAMHFENGIGIHHAGMLRADRKLTEQMFADGAIRVLCCTATLAWGVNLPAHTIVIKGTDVYNPEKGGNVDLSILDVQQIFGRAGRPQFDTSGEATLITTADAFQRYLDKLVLPVPIESNFTKQLPDHLNAEIVGSTVTSITEAARWLTYTYLYVRMMRNPLAYGISGDERYDDPLLKKRCTELVSEAAKQLDRSKMIKYDPASGNLSAMELGRIAAHFYVQAESVEIFHERMGVKVYLTDADMIRLVASATEFKNMKLRQEEMDELQELLANGDVCPLSLEGAGRNADGKSLITDSGDKVFVLMQAYISRAKVKSFTLISDVNYVASNAGRVARALFEMCLKQNKPAAALKLLRLAKSVDNRIWFFQSPLRQFEGELNENVLFHLEAWTARGEYDTLASTTSLLDLQAGEVGQLAHWQKGGSTIQALIRMLPKLDITCNVQPVTAEIVKFSVKVAPSFNWQGRWHGGAQSYWLWAEDVDSGTIRHHEQLIIGMRTRFDAVVLDFHMPTFGKTSGQFLVRVISDSWVGVEQAIPVTLNELVTIPSQKEVVTALQDLTPLPTGALQDSKFEQLYKFETFNPIQTQLFHVLYHTNTPVLLGAPTGSGKTAVAEIAILRMKRLYPRGVCVYIAPLKALARERLKEWRLRLGAAPLNWKILELSGDTNYDQSALDRADILICTPEKYDLISRNWRGLGEDAVDAHGGRSFIKRVRLLVIDEVHLLGEDRGAVLEAIVSRTRFISRFIKKQRATAAMSQPTSDDSETRIIGLSTFLGNAVDLGDWIGIDTTGGGPKGMRGLYNFRHSVRPVPIKIHCQGYSGRHYCPRMATMNRPCFRAIKEHSPTKPALIFVASRRQTRLTAFDIISYAAYDSEPKRFLKCDEAYIEAVAMTIRDEALRHTIAFGIGLHHAGLSQHDREIVEKMYLSGEIQVLVATATLAWGVNLPAHLVIVKGTEYFDGKTSRYVDYPLTDIMQMVGRAGRPGFDTSAVAVVMSTAEKKVFYKKFLHMSFPVESCLEERLCECINAEIASRTISSLVEAAGYLTWTFYARRVKGNPAYYGASATDDESVEQFLLSKAREALQKLRESGCIEYDTKEEYPDVSPLDLGLACAKYYLAYRTPKQMQLGVREARRLVLSCLEESANHDHQSRQDRGELGSLTPLQRPERVDEVSAAWLLYTLCSTHEFDEHPVRHNEEYLNQELADELMWGPDTTSLVSGNQDVHHNMEVFQDPHTKCFLLIQAYLERARVPISDYVNDCKSVMENVPRLLAAMQYIASQECAAAGSLELLTQFARTKQLVETRSVVGDDPLLQLPSITGETARRLVNGGKSKQRSVDSLAALRAMPPPDAESILQKVVKKALVGPGLDALYALPQLRLLECKISNDIDKRTGQSTGRAKVKLGIDRIQPTRKAKTDEDKNSLTLNLLLGSYQQGFLLASSNLRLSRFGQWTVERELEFDWAAANADGGEDGGRVTLRLLFDEVRGLDSEATIALR